MKKRKFRVRKIHSIDEWPLLFQKPFYYEENMGIRKLYACSYDVNGICRKRLIYATDNINDFWNELKKRNINYKNLRW